MLSPAATSSGAAPDELNQLRLGVLRFASGDDPQINEQFNDTLVRLKRGVTLVDIDLLLQSDYWRNELIVLEIEFADSSTGCQSRADHCVALGALIEFNLAHGDTELALFEQEHFISSANRPSIDSPEYEMALSAIRAASGQDGIDLLLSEANVDLLIAPSGPVSPAIDFINGDVWPPWVGAGHLAAVAGYPHLSIPMGVVRGLPLGMSVIGAINDDVKVLLAGQAIEGIVGPAPIPKFLPSASSHPEIRSSIEGGR